MSFNTFLSQYKTKKRSIDEVRDKATEPPMKSAAVEPPPTIHEKEIPNLTVNETGDFYKIGRKCGTDKITHHGYHRFYPRFLELYRRLSSEYGMLEIGIEESKSVNTWRQYFQELYIYGIDINLNSSGERYEIHAVDQSDHLAMQKFVEERIHHSICFIIDDGSHIPEHQLSCFDYLFDRLLIPGGTYIIEDIETSYWRRGGLYGYPTRYGYDHPANIIHIMKDLLDDINREFLSEENREKLDQKLVGKVSSATRKMIQSITFGQNCIIIVKKTSEEMKYENRTYRFEDHL
jgi:hypothetical protein